MPDTANARAAAGDVGEGRIHPGRECAQIAKEPIASRRPRPSRGRPPRRVACYIRLMATPASSKSPSADGSNLISCVPLIKTNLKIWMTEFLACEGQFLCTPQRDPAA